MAHSLDPRARLTELDRLYRARTLRRAVHPTLPLAIYNYTSVVQYKKLWTDLLMQCRGLVVNTNTGGIVASPMAKFFNHEDHEAIKVDVFNCDVLEKLDGSLGIYFHFKGEWIMASRGSFTSEQAQVAGQIALDNDLSSRCNPAYTYLFEIIYPENRIVVDYGDRSELVMLALVHTATSKDEPLARVAEEARRIGVSTPRSFPADSAKALQALDSHNEEGFVLRDRTSGHRFKIKFPRYVEMHLVRTRFSMSHVRAWYIESTDWQLASDKYEYIPDEVFALVQQEWARLDSIRHDAQTRLQKAIDECKDLAFRDVPATSMKGYVCKYLRLSRQGDNPAIVFEDYIKHCIAHAPESPFEPATFNGGKEDD